MTDQTDRAVLARIGQMADYWEQQLPEVIRTPAVVSALRAALEPAGQAPVTDQTALRDRIADTLAAADGWQWVDDRDKARSSTYRSYQSRADAVVAVLPAPVDQAATYREAAERLDVAAERESSLSSSDYDHEAYAARQLREQAAGMRRMADEMQSAPPAPSA